MSNQYFIKCDCCDREVEYSNHKYYGRVCKTWGMFFCSRCRRANHDGIVLETHPSLKAKFEAANIEVKYNANGWVDIPS